MNLGVLLHSARDALLFCRSYNMPKCSAVAMQNASCRSGSASISNLVHFARSPDWPRTKDVDPKKMLNQNSPCLQLRFLHFVLLCGWGFGGGGWIERESVKGQV